MSSPTLHDIARLAGVSPTTVSLVLNEKGNISDETRIHVKEVIYRYGYKRRPSSRCIGLVGHPPQDLSQSIRQAAAEYGYDIQAFDVKGCEDALDAHHPKLAGVVIYGGRANVAAVDAISQRFATILVGAHARRLNVDSIWVDNAYGIEQAVEHLVRQGHSRIGLVNGPVDTPTSWEKQSGFDHAMAFAEVPVCGTSVATASFSTQAARHAVAQLLDQDSEITAVIVAETTAGIAVFEYLREQGVMIPRDMSLIVFRDDPRLQSTNPPITAICFSYIEISRETLGRLVTRMADPTAGGRRILFKPHIVERGTVLAVDSKRRIG